MSLSKAADTPCTFGPYCLGAVANVCSATSTMKSRACGYNKEIERMMRVIDLGHVIFQIAKCQWRLREPYRARSIVVAEF
jgi:hypothetical protein